MKIYKVKESLWCRTSLYKPCAVFLKKKSQTITKVYLKSAFFSLTDSSSSDRV